MESSSGHPFRFRGAVAALAALLVSVSALALPPPSGKAPSCLMSGAATCCCTEGDAPRDSSAGCCRQAVPEEAAPWLQSHASLALAVPAVPTPRGLPPPGRPRGGGALAQIDRLPRPRGARRDHARSA